MCVFQAFWPQNTVICSEHGRDGTLQNPISAVSEISQKSYLLLLRNSQPSVATLTFQVVAFRCPHAHARVGMSENSLLAQQWGFLKISNHPFLSMSTRIFVATYFCRKSPNKYSSPFIGQYALKNRSRRFSSVYLIAKAEDHVTFFSLSNLTIS